MAVSASLVNDTTVRQTGDGADDIINGDTFLEGDFRPDDIIYGGGGDDNLNGRTGINEMYGEGGNDSFWIGSSGATYDRAYGGKGSDTFTVQDVPNPGGPLHLVDGGKGHDILYAGLYNHSEGVTYRHGTLSVGGMDVANIMSVEQLIGTVRNDTIYAGDGLFQVQGLGGEDVIRGGDNQQNLLSGGSGNDSLTGGNKADEIYDGDERLLPGSVIPRFYSDTDTLSGGNGNDTLIAVSGDDEIYGKSGDDQIYSLLGNDLLKGGDGDDLFGFTYWTFYEDADEALKTDLARSQYNLGGLNIFGGDGIDVVTFYGTYVSVSAGDVRFDRGVKVNLADGVGVELGSGTQRAFAITGVENLIGTDRKDKLIGDNAGNRLDGGKDKDNLSGGKGNDTLLGGNGKDKLKGDDNNDVLDGGKKDDVLKGGTGNDTLLGGEGNDKLKGGSEHDVLVGGVGNDNLNGGDGLDVFEFFASLLPGDADKIKDFSLEDDIIRIQGNDPIGFADLTIKVNDGNARIVLDDWNVVLTGVAKADLTADHFEFVVL